MILAQELKMDGDPNRCTIPFDQSGWSDIQVLTSMGGNDVRD